MSLESLNVTHYFNLMKYHGAFIENTRYHQSQQLSNPYGIYMSHLKTHYKGMTIISHFKFKGSKWKQYKHSFCNWKLL